MTPLPVVSPVAERTGFADRAKVAIRSDADFVHVRELTRALAGQLGFSCGDSTLITTAVSELARNILQYAQHGEITVERTEDHGRRGIAIVAQDEGPGICNVGLAMQIGFTTSGGLGVGLPGVRRMMDEFAITSGVGRGTTVSVKKWRR